MDEQYKGEWQIHMGEYDKKFKLNLGKNFSDISIIPPTEVIETQSVNVTCKVTGGVPTPKVTFMLMDSDNKTVNGSEERFSKEPVNQPESGEDVLVVTKTFTPEREDNGLRLCCRAEQPQLFNNNNKVSSSF